MSTLPSRFLSSAVASGSLRYGGMISLGSVVIRHVVCGGLRYTEMSFWWSAVTSDSLRYVGIISLGSAVIRHMVCGGLR